MQLMALAFLVLGCAEAESGPLTFDDFFTQLPDAVCDYYEQRDEIASTDRAQCPQDLYLSLDSA